MTSSVRLNADLVVQECLCLTIRCAARAVSQLYDVELEGTGLTNGQFTLLAQIKLNPASIVSELATRLLVDRTTLTRNLKLLEQPGLLQLSNSDRDARKSVISLTAQGERALAQGFPGWLQAQERLADAMGGPTRDNALNTVRALIRNLKQPGTPRRRVATDAPGPAHQYEHGYLTRAEFDILRTQMCAATVLRRSSRAITAHYDAKLRPVGLLASQLHVLAAIDAAPGTRLGAFVDLLTLDQTTLTRLMQRLNKLGLTSMLADGPQKRGFVLTDTGRRTLADALPLWYEAQCQAIVEGGASQASRLIELMRKVVVAAHTAGASVLPSA